MWGCGGGLAGVRTRGLVLWVFLWVFCVFCVLWVFCLLLVFCVLWARVCGEGHKGLGILCANAFKLAHCVVE